MSNVNISDSVLEAFQRQKLGRGKILYVIFEIDGEEVKVAKEVKRDDEGADFDSFRDEVLDNYMDKGCYAVYDYNWKTGGVNKQKLIFISCVSDELPIRKKMMYGSSKEQVKAKLDGVAQKAVHVTDADDLTEEALQSVF